MVERSLIVSGKLAVFSGVVHAAIQWDGSGGRFDFRPTLIRPHPMYR